MYEKLTIADKGESKLLPVPIQLQGSSKIDSKLFIFQAHILSRVLFHFNSLISGENSMSFFKISLVRNESVLAKHNNCKGLQVFNSTLILFIYK